MPVSAMSDLLLLLNHHAHIFCTGKLRFVASLSTSGHSHCHHCNLTQPTNPPGTLPGLTNNQPTTMTSTSQMDLLRLYHKSSLSMTNSSASPHELQPIKCIPSFDCNPGKRCKSTSTMSSTNQPKKSVNSELITPLHLIIFLTNSN